MSHLKCSYPSSTSTKRRCRPSDAGYIASTPELYEVSIASSLVFARAPVNDTWDVLEAFLAARLTEDFSDLVDDGADVGRVGPVVETGAGVEVFFAVLANYTAAAAENMSTVAGLIAMDFADEASLTVYNGGLEAFLDASTYDVDDGVGTRVMVLSPVSREALPGDLSLESPRGVQNSQESVPTRMFWDRELISRLEVSRRVDTVLL